MKRNAIQDLIAWKSDEERKPMVLKGARQVGKTWLMKTFGQEYYNNYVYFNFDEEDDLIYISLCCQKRLSAYLLTSSHPVPYLKIIHIQLILNLPSHQIIKQRKQCNEHNGLCSGRRKPSAEETI